MADKEKSIFDLAQEKGVNIIPYILQGVPIEALRKALEEYSPPPSNPISALYRGAIGGGEELLGGLAGLVGAKEFAKKELSKAKMNRPAPNAGLSTKIGGILGSLIPYALTGLAEAVAPIPGSRAALLAQLGRFAIPALIGASTAGEARTEGLPWKEAIPMGALQGVSFGLLPKLGDIAEELGARIAPELMEKRLLGKIPLAKTAVRATALPVGAYATQLGEEALSGQPTHFLPTTENLKDLTANYLASLLLEGLTGYSANKYNKGVNEPQTQPQVTTPTVEKQAIPLDINTFLKSLQPEEQPNEQPVSLIDLLQKSWNWPREIPETSSVANLIQQTLFPAEEISRPPTYVQTALPLEYSYNYKQTTLPFEWQPTLLNYLKGEVPEVRNIAEETPQPVSQPFANKEELLNAIKEIFPGSKLEEEIRRIKENAKQEQEAGKVYEGVPQPEVSEESKEEMPTPESVQGVREEGQTVEEKVADFAKQIKVKPEELQEALADRYKWRDLWDKFKKKPEIQKALLEFKQSYQAPSPKQPQEDVFANAPTVEVPEAGQAEVPAPKPQKTEVPSFTDHIVNKLANNVGFILKERLNDYFNKGGSELPAELAEEGMTRGEEQQVTGYHTTSGNLPPFLKKRFDFIKQAYKEAVVPFDPLKSAIKDADGNPIKFPTLDEAEEMADKSREPVVPYQIEDGSFVLVPEESLNPQVDTKKFLENLTQQKGYLKGSNIDEILPTPEDKLLAAKVLSGEASPEEREQFIDTITTNIANNPTLSRLVLKEELPGAFEKKEKAINSKAASAGTLARLIAYKAGKANPLALTEADIDKATNELGIKLSKNEKSLLLKSRSSKDFKEGWKAATAKIKELNKRKDKEAFLNNVLKEQANEFRNIKKPVLNETEEAKKSRKQLASAFLTKEKLPGIYKLSYKMITNHFPSFYLDYLKSVRGNLPEDKKILVDNVINQSQEVASKFEITEDNINRAAQKLALAYGKPNDEQAFTAIKQRLTALYNQYGNEIKPEAIVLSGVPVSARSKATTDYVILGIPKELLTVGEKIESPEFLKKQVATIEKQRQEERNFFEEALGQPRTEKVSKFLYKPTGEKIYIALPKDIFDNLDNLTYKEFEKALPKKKENLLNIINKFHSQLFGKAFIEPRQKITGELKPSRVLEALSSTYLSAASFAQKNDLANLNLFYLLKNWKRIPDFIPALNHVVSLETEGFTPENWLELGMLLKRKKILGKIVKALGLKKEPLGEISFSKLKGQKELADKILLSKSLEGWPNTWNEFVRQGKDLSDLIGVINRPPRTGYKDVLNWLKQKGIIDEVEARAIDRNREFFSFRRMDYVDELFKNPDLFAQDPTKVYELGNYILAKTLGKEYKLNVLNDKDLVRLMYAKTGVPFAGMVDKLAKVVYVVPHSLDAKEISTTIGHEAFHVLWDTFTEQEKNLLLKTYGGLEDAADAFGKYVSDQIYPSSSIIKRVFDKVYEFIHKLVNMFEGYGFRSTKDLFERAWLGQNIDKLTEDDLINLPAAVYDHSWDILNRNVDFRTLDRVLEAKENFRKEDIKELYQDWIKPFLVAAKDRIPKFFRHVTLPLYHDVLYPVYEKFSLAADKVGKYALYRYARVTEALKNLNKENETLFKVLNDTAFQLNEQRTALYKTNYAEFSDLVKNIGKKYGLNLSDTDIAIIERHLDLMKSTKFDPDYKKMLANSLDTYRYAFFKRMENIGKTGVLADLLDVPEIQKLVALIPALNNSIQKYFIEYALNPDRETNEVLSATKSGAEILNELGLPELKHIKPDEQIKVSRIPYRLISEIKDIQKRLIKNASEKNVNQIAGINAYLDELSELKGNLNKVYSALHELDKGYYLPILRNGGDYFITISQYDPEEKRYKQIYFWDTQPKLVAAGTREKAEMLRQLEELKKKYGNSFMVDLDNPSLRNLRQQYATIEEFLDALQKRKLADIKEPPEFVISFGKKGRLDPNIMEKLSPYETLSLIDHLASKANMDEQLVKRLSTKALEDFAEQQFGVARRLQRSKAPIEGYKKDLMDVIHRHNVAITAHFANAEFNRLMRQAYLEKRFQELRADPETADLIDKYIDMVTAPVTKAGKVMFKLRNLAVLYYIGGRISTAVLNTFQLPFMFQNELAALLKNPELYFSSIRKLTDAPEEAKLREFGGLSKEAAKLWVMKAPRKYLPMLEFMRKNSIFTPATDGGFSIADIMFHPDRIDSIDDNVFEKAGYSKEQIREVTRYLAELEETGVIESSILNMIRIEQGGNWGRWGKALTEYGMLPFRSFENFGRILAALTLKDVMSEKMGINWSEYFDKPLTEDHPIELAGLVLKRCFGDYSRVNRLWWSNPSRFYGVITTPMMTLQGYNLHLLSYIAEAFGRSELKKVGMLLGAIGALGGVQALLDTPVSMIDNVLGTNIRMKTKQKLEKEFGGVAANMILKGLPTLFNVDLSGSLKIELPFVPRGLSKEDLADAYMGVYGSLFDRASDAIHYLSIGDYLGALVNAAPMGISYPLKAIDLKLHGLRTKWSKPIVDPETMQQVIDDNPYDLVLLSMGFRPVKLANIQEKRYLAMKLARRFADEKKRLLAMYRDRVLDGDTEDIKDVLNKIEDFNIRALEYVPLTSPITAQGLKRTLNPKSWRDKYLAIYGQ